VKKEDLIKLCNEKPVDRDDYPYDPGVLLSDQIKHYATKHKMIIPFDEDNLKPAGRNGPEKLDTSEAGIK